MGNTWSTYAVLRFFLEGLLCRSLIGLSCVAETRATRPNGEWGYSTRRHMLGHECPGVVSPARGVVLADLQ
jgi:hypothetical protein